MASALHALRARLLGLPPTVRKAIAAGVAVLAVVVVGGSLKQDAPREVGLRVRLGAWGDGPVEVVRVSFARRGEVLRVVELRPGGGASRAVSARVSLPEGALSARVELVADGRVAESEGPVTVRAGEELDIPPPPR